MNEALRMPIDSLIERTFACVNEDDGFEIVLAQFIASRNPVVLVKNLEGRLSGIITSFDIARGAMRFSRDLTAKDVATLTNVLAIQRQATLAESLRILNGENINSRVLNFLPVLDADHRPIGLILRENLVRNLASLELKS